MNKKDIEIGFAEIKGEFKIIKRLIYIIIAILIGLLLRVVWVSVTQDLIIMA